MGTPTGRVSTRLRSSTTPSRAHTTTGTSVQSNRTTSPMTQRSATTDMAIPHGRAPSTSHSRGRNGTTVVPLVLINKTSINKSTTSRVSTSKDSVSRSPTTSSPATSSLTIKDGNRTDPFIFPSYLFSFDVDF